MVSTDSYFSSSSLYSSIRNRSSAGPEDVAAPPLTRMLSKSPDAPRSSFTSSCSSSSSSSSSLYKSLALRLGCFDSSLKALQELRSHFFRNEHHLSDDEFRLSASTVSRLPFILRLFHNLFLSSISLLTLDRFSVRLLLDHGLDRGKSLIIRCATFFSPILMYLIITIICTARLPRPR